MEGVRVWALLWRCVNIIEEANDNVHAVETPPGARPLQVSEASKLRRRLENCVVMQNQFSVLSRKAVPWDFVLPSMLMSGPKIYKYIYIYSCIYSENERLTTDSLQKVYNSRTCILRPLLQLTKF